jgi:hypothetical protein
MTQVAIGVNVALALSSIHGRFWHKVRAQLGSFEGTETGALPTIAPERRFRPISTAPPRI